MQAIVAAAVLLRISGVAIVAARASDKQRNNIARSVEGERPFMTSHLPAKDDSASMQRIDR
jgi:hypothetical protein